MSHNGPSPDRWPAEAFRAQAETIGRMHELGWSVWSYCRTCDLRMPANLAIMIKISGPGLSLWNLQLPCRRVGCNGHAVFEARPPGRGMALKLEASFPGGPAPKGRSGPSWL